MMNGSIGEFPIGFLTRKPTPSNSSLASLIILISRSSGIFFFILFYINNLKNMIFYIIERVGRKNKRFYTSGYQTQRKVKAIFLHRFITILRSLSDYLCISFTLLSLNLFPSIYVFLKYANLFLFPKQIYYLNKQHVSNIFYQNSIIKIFLIKSN